MKLTCILFAHEQITKMQKTGKVIECMVIAAIQPPIKHKLRAIQVGIGLLNCIDLLLTLQNKFIRSIENKKIIIVDALGTIQKTLLGVEAFQFLPVKSESPPPQGLAESGCSPSRIGRIWVPLTHIYIFINTPIYVFSCLI